MEASVRLVRCCLKGLTGLISGLISSVGWLGTSRNGVTVDLQAIGNVPDGCDFAAPLLSLTSGAPLTQTTGTVNPPSTSACLPTTTMRPFISYRRSNRLGSGS